MAVRTFGEPIAEFLGESVTTGTTITAVGIPPGVEEVIVYPVTNAHRVQIGARIAACLKTTDSAATFTDYTTQATDRVAATVADLSSLDTAANGDYWYLASKHKFAGATVDILAGNTTASVLTGYYWNGTAWTLITVTDGTIVATGKCLGQDGNLTWTVPTGTSWARTTTTDNSGLNSYAGLYAMRFQVSVVLYSATTISEIALLPDTTAAAAGYMAVATDYVFSLNPVECGSLAFYNATGAASVSLSWLRHSKLGST